MSSFIRAAITRTENQERKKSDGEIRKLCSANLANWTKEIPDTGEAPTTGCTSLLFIFVGKNGGSLSGTGFPWSHGVPGVDSTAETDWLFAGVQFPFLLWFPLLLSFPR